MAKAAIELRDLRQFAKGLAPEAVSEDQIEMWSAVGQVLYGRGDLKGATPSGVLDDASRALIVRLHNAVPRELRATGEQLDAMIARLEQTIVADSALNQLRLRPQIGREIVRRGGRDRLRDAECLDLRRGLSHAEAGRLAWPLAAGRVHRLARRRCRDAVSIVCCQLTLELSD